MDVTGKHVKYNPNKDLKTFDYVLFETVSSNFGPECIYLRYIDLNVI